MRRALQILSITLLTILLLAIFLWNSNLADVWRILKSTSILWFAVGLLTNFTALIFRTFRWRVLLDRDHPPPFYPTFFANTTGYMLSTVLPIRAGDVARPALLARRTSVRFAVALGTVLTERIVDLVAIILVYDYYCFKHWNDFTEGRAVVQEGAIGASAVLLALVFLTTGIFFFRNQVRRLHAWIGKIVPNRFREAWMNFFDSFARSLDIARHPVALLKVLGCTVLIWLCLTAQFWWVMIAAHRPLDFDTSFFICGVTTIGLAIPTPGGVGGFHKICQYVLTTFYKFDIDSSVAVTVLLHIVGTLPVVVTGLVLFFHEGLNWKQLKEQTSRADES
ncbi:MAG TPA: lysylphosphatidylglycerol synthase transmembrane domain-containing protein [Thermoanaerobaculia bacterium]|nr:lysylphosphatidylglycerol synthase transmembrane domain-containing protein [Thermoanaerobaculia bacterium]